jgi:hypothetical protein
MEFLVLLALPALQEKMAQLDLQGLRVQLAPQAHPALPVQMDNLAAMDRMRPFTQSNRTSEH